jgi:hypothetical protein
MKQIITIIVLLCSSLLFSQETSFTFTKEGLTDFIVTPCEGKTQAELYKKALDWVSITYKNPNEVVKAKIENEYIRIEGSSSDIICYSYMGKRCGDTKYEVEISFKDGKYKFDVLSVSEYNTPSQTRAAIWTNFNINDASAFYDKKGGIKKSYKYIPEMMPAYFNNLNLNLKDFLVSDSIQSKKSDW